jgi:hypothetical protein
MIEYGVRDPDVIAATPTGDRQLTYVTDVRRTIATPGVWFPFRAVITTDKEWRKLRGWDRTHEYDAAYELVETIFAGHGARHRGVVDDRLENGVYSFQYHPELARDPSLNNGKGTLDYVRYCINLAERSNYWIATQAELYQRMADYEQLGFEVREDGREVVVSNPTDRRVVAMVVEQRLPFGSVWHGAEELIHVAHGAFVTVPPLDPGASVTLQFRRQEMEALLLRHPSNKGLVVLDARHDPASGEVRILVSVCRRQPLAVEGVDPDGAYRVQIDDEPPFYAGVRTVRTIQAKLGKKTDAASGNSRRADTPGTTRFLDLEIEGGENDFVERTIRIRQLTAAEAHGVKAALIAALPEKRGRVT